MTEVRKAVITAAGRGTRQYPATNTVQKELFPLVDRDGYAKPTLQIIVEEALASGIETLCIIVNPTNADPIKQHFRGLTQIQKTTQFTQKEWALRFSDALEDMAQRITFLVQPTQEGYGHAVYQARDWVGEEPFALLLGDHVYISQGDQPCTRQVIAAFEKYQSPMTSVFRSPESELYRYGTIAGKRMGDHSPPIYEIRALAEKPTVEYARQHLQTSGLAEGEYLAHFGSHVFPPAIFDCLEELIRSNIRQKNEIQLTSAQELLMQRERYLVCEVQGQRCDMGIPEGFIETQIALALHSPFAAQTREMLK